jgi:hypothetical protein
MMALGFDLILGTLSMMAKILLAAAFPSAIF